MGSINVCTIVNQNQAKLVLCRTLSSRQPVISFTTPRAKEIGRANFASSMDGTSAHLHLKHSAEMFNVSLGRI